MSNSSPRMYERGEDGVRSAKLEMWSAVDGSESG